MWAVGMSFNIWNKINLCMVYRTPMSNFVHLAPLIVVEKDRIIKNIYEYTLWAQQRHLLPFTYIATNLVYPVL